VLKFGQTRKPISQALLPGEAKTPILSVNLLKLSVIKLIMYQIF